MPAFAFLSDAESGKPSSPTSTASPRTPDSDWPGAPWQAGSRSPYSHTGIQPIPRPRRLSGGEAPLGNPERHRPRRWRDSLDGTPRGASGAHEAKGIPPTGTENYGGPIVTAGGLIFIGATKDEKFRAFDKRDGEGPLGDRRFPPGGYATPGDLRGRTGSSTSSSRPEAARWARNPATPTWPLRSPIEAARNEWPPGTPGNPWQEAGSGPVGTVVQEPHRQPAGGVGVHHAERPVCHVDVEALGRRRLLDEANEGPDHLGMGHEDHDPSGVNAASRLDDAPNPFAQIDEGLARGGTGIPASLPGGLASLPRQRGTVPGPAELEGTNTLLDSPLDPQRRAHDLGGFNGSLRGRAQELVDLEWRERTSPRPRPAHDPGT